MAPRGMFLLDKTKPKYFTCGGGIHSKVAMFLIIVFTLIGEVVELCAYIFGGKIPTDFEMVFEIIEYFITFTLVLGFVTEQSILLTPFIGQLLVVVVVFLLNTLLLFYSCLFPYSSVARDFIDPVKHASFWQREQKFLFGMAMMTLFTTFFGWCLQVAFSCYSYFEDRMAEKKTREGRPPVDPNVSRPPLVQPSFSNPNFSIEDDEDNVFENKPNSPAQLGIVPDFFAAERPLSFSDAMNNNNETLVLVTGASGYVGSHCVKELLKDGYRVRGTVRSLHNVKKITPIRKLAENKEDQLELVEADLMEAGGWDAAMAGCDFVLHVASPFPIVADKKCIETAINGTLNVLKAANRCNSVKKVVLTSSCAAVNEGHPQNKVFDETSWTDVDSSEVDDYARSKTLAEKAAWEFGKNIQNGNKFALTTINPTFVVGPLLIDEQGASITVLRRFLNLEMPAVPPLNLACVDVRDVARAHIEAMRRPESDGERFLCTSQPSFWFLDIARVLRKEFSSQGYWIPCLQAPYWVLWLYSFFDSQASACLNRAGHKIRFDNSKAETTFQMKFRDPSKSMVEMAYTLIERGIVKKSRGYKGMPEELQKELQARREKK